MTAPVQQLKQKAQELLASGKVRYLLGYAQAFDGVGVRPAVFYAADDLERMVLDARAVPGLVSYLFLEARENPSDPGPVGVVVKGCDVRAAERLVADHRVPRERIVMLGVPCQGVIDPELLGAAGLGEVAAVELDADSFVVSGVDGETRRLPRDEYLLAKCRSCTDHNPRAADIMLAEPVDVADASGPDFAEVEQLDGMDDAERYEFWKQQLSKCIRCYACRNVCPACTCRSCVFDQAEPDWLNESVNMSEQMAFHFTRAWHVAGRCVDCWECQRVCPVGIPLMLLNHKLMKDVGEMFGIERPFAPAEREPLGCYSSDDPDFE